MLDLWLTIDHVYSRTTLWLLAETVKFWPSIAWVSFHRVDTEMVSRLPSVCLPCVQLRSDQRWVCGRSPHPSYRTGSSCQFVAWQLLQALRLPRRYEIGTGPILRFWLCFLVATSLVSFHHAILGYNLPNEIGYLAEEVSCWHAHDWEWDLTVFIGKAIIGYMVGAYWAWAKIFLETFCRYHNSWISGGCISRASAFQVPGFSHEHHKCRSWTICNAENGFYR